MRIPARFGSVVAVATLAVSGLAVTGLAGPAGAVTSHGGDAGGARHVVFVQTDNVAGNKIAAYHRTRSGRLILAGTFATGGKGGVLDGSVTDHLASQGSLMYDRRHRLLYAVNAGSNTVSVFSARGDHLSRREIVGTGGRFPVSIAVHGDLVYVLNALNGGSVRGYRVHSGLLLPIPGSARPLDLDPTATPQFVNTPGQVAFSPDGSQLIVTTKANGSDIDVFGVRPNGRLSASPVVNSEPGAVPFAITFDQNEHLVIAEAGPNALATFTLNANHTVTPIDTLGNGQVATCWVLLVHGSLFASNTGSSTISGYTSSPTGQLSLTGDTPTDTGTVDLAAAPDGRHLYAQTGGKGIVDEFKVSDSGTLTEIGHVTVPGAVGGEGIAAA